MKAPRTLSAPARELLAHLGARGTATSAELRSVQRALGDGRSDAAHSALPYNMRAMGYIDQVPNRTPPQWTLTAAGRAAAARAAQERGVEPSPVPRGEAAPPPARLIKFAGRPIPVPTGPRWVFDLANEPTT